MDELQIVMIGLVGLFFLMAWGVPVGMVLLIVGATGAWALTGSFAAGAGLIFISAHNVTDQYALVVVPLFILMGELAAVTGLTEDVFRAAYRNVGRVPGGLAVATNFACAGFGAITGSSLSATVAMTRVTLPEMRKYKYKDELSTGVIAAAGAFAIMIPPSIMLVVYGMLAEQSIGRLLMAGIMPGLVTAIVFSILIVTRTTLDPSLGPKGAVFTWKEKLLSLVSLGPFLIIALTVLLGILFGIWTPTEAGAVGAVAVLVLGLIRRKLSWREVRRTARDATLTSTSVFVIVIGAYVFSRFLAMAGVTDLVMEGILAMGLGPFGIFIVLVILYLALGCLMDGISMLALTLPMVLPIASASGWDPIWLGIVLTLLVEISLVTPPVGLNLYALRATAPDVPLGVIIRGALPFVGCDLIVLFILYFAPRIALWLPGMMF